MTRRKTTPSNTASEDKPSKLKSSSKSTGAKVTSKRKAKASGDAKTLIEAAGENYWQRAMALNSEAARLASVRADRYREFFEELSTCQTPVDTSEAFARAAEVCFQDYMDEVGRLAQIAMSGAKE